MRRVAEQGEPWQSLFAPEDLRGKLAGMGFSSVFHLTPEMARERYFRGRRDGLTPPGFAQMMAATV